MRLLLFLLISFCIQSLSIGQIEKNYTNPEEDSAQKEQNIEQKIQEKEIPNKTENY